MSLGLPPLQLSGGAGGAAGPANGTSNTGTPVNISLPWQSTKNYQNHTNGSSQSATASADQTASAAASGSGFDMKWVLIGLAAWYLLD